MGEITRGMSRRATDGVAGGDALRAAAGPADPAMDLLAAGVPLSLLIDLFTPTGPDSAELFRAETADTRWIHRVA